MTSKLSKQAGFGIIEIIVVICVLGAAIFAGWYIWHDSKKSSTDVGGTVGSFEECKKAGNPIQESYPEVCITKDGKSFTNPAQAADQHTSGAVNREGQAVLQIKEWGVEVPLNNSHKDMVYHYAKNDIYEAVSFTFKPLQEKDMCKTDVGVSLTRKKTENDPPFNIDNPQSFKKLGTYYYYVAQASGPCYDPNNVKDKNVIQQVSGEQDIRAFVIDSLKDLRITDN